MAQNPFPKVRGFTLNIHRRRLPSTRVVSHVSGREVREQQYKYPLYEFDLSIAVMTAETQDGAPYIGGIGARSLQAIDAHHGNNAGSFVAFPFKYADFSRNSDDSSLVGQQIGVGDGSTTSFSVMRQVTPNGLETPYIEPVGMVEALGLNVYVGGSLQSASTYALTYPNKIVFNSAPAALAAIAVDCTYYYLCRYKDDVLDFEQLYKGIHRIETITLRTVKVP